MKKDNSARVYRGGCWYDVARFARVANRYGYIPSNRNDYLGFRLVRCTHPLQQLSEVFDEKR